MKKIALLGGAFVAFAGVAHAATTPNSIVTPQTPNRGILQFLQGSDSAGTYKTLYTAGSNGSRCYSMLMNNNDSSTAHLVTVQIINGGIKYGGTALTTVTSAGFANGTAAQPLMSPSIWPGLAIDQYGNSYVQLITGDTIQATFGTNLTNSSVINLYTSCSDF